MNKIANKTKWRLRPNLKRFTTITIASVLLGGSAAPVLACVPHRAAASFETRPVHTSGHKLLLLADADDNFSARSEVDADRIHEHAERAENRAREDAHEAARDARIHADRAEVRVHACRSRKKMDGPPNRRCSAPSRDGRAKRGLAGAELNAPGSRRYKKPTEEPGVLAVASYSVLRDQQ